jgi:hypothetical protein
MEARELIAKLEEIYDEADALTRQLIADLKEREAAKEALQDLQIRRLEQRTAAIALVVEANFASGDLDRAELRKKVYGRMGFGRAS